MKNIKSFIIIILFAGSTGAMAQNASSSATAKSLARIVAPIAITKNTDMNFGIVAASGQAGTVILVTGSTTTTTGNVTLPATNPGTITAAAFTVTGEEDYVYSIEHPVSIVLSDDSENDMTVSSINNSIGIQGTLVGSTQTILLGGTLEVGANQVPNLYKNESDLTVTVNYN
jgi:hypothetical protein